MKEFVTVRPAPHRRREFAQWCLAQRPTVRTVSGTASAVPLVLYPDVPSVLLEGALVDGRPVGKKATKKAAKKATKRAAKKTAKKADPEPAEPSPVVTEESNGRTFSDEGPPSSGID